MFALLMVGIGIAGHREFLGLASLLNSGGAPPRTGYAIIVLFALAAFLINGPTGAIAVTMAAVAVPLIVLVFRRNATGSFAAWSLSVAGSLYLGLPVYAAIALRLTSGSTRAHWLNGLTAFANIGFPTLPRALAWTLLTILSVWVGDTSAYLVGRTIGRHPLAPFVSPNKTVEGAIGGLVGSSVVGGLVATVGGLGFPLWAGIAIGCAIGVVGQLGDLAESFLKRQAGVKDSGRLIPGHGGILDRTDALLFAFPVAWGIAAITG